MKTAILYMSQHGTAEKAAQLLSQRLPGEEVTVINLKAEKDPDLAPFDKVIVGSSIHAGRIQNGVRKFLAQHTDQLLGKCLGLYLCCMDDKTEQKEFDDNYPEELRTHARAKGLFGGEFLLEKMNFVERLIVKKVAGQVETVSKLRPEAIDRFAREMQAGC